MLYNEKWDKQTKADPLTLNGLIAWLEQQPADTSYCYTIPQTCLIARYLMACGVDDYVLDSYELNHRVPGLSNIVQGNGFSSEWTYGAALKRARAAVHD